MPQEFLGKEKNAAIASFVALLAIYSATLAPTVTYWDSGEFLAAIHSLGIPHPPGTPLYIIVANGWSQITGPVFGFALSVNLFSAVCAAMGCALIANLVSRWTRDPYSGFAAAVCTGATSSLWMSATETEVYAPAFLVAILLIWIGNRNREARDPKYVVLLIYVAALGWALHLTALIALPAALVLAVDYRDRFKFKTWMSAGFVALLGASVVLFMYLRAQHDPAINQGNPASLAALSDVIARRQYGELSVWPRQAPLYLQFGNVFEWADWQFALGLSPSQPPSMMRTPVTILFALLGVFGFAQHRRLHRVSWRAITVLFVTAFVGVVLYLNLKAGPSYGIGFLPANAPHEARERDYFFILVWVVWGMWAGVGAVRVAHRFAPIQLVAPLALMIAASPIVMNWRAVDRSREPGATEALEFASGILRLAGSRAVVLAQGDNDTYPVWYVREVEKRRPDIATITVPMLSVRWYREEISRRYGLLDSASVRDWKGTAATIRVICERAGAQSRRVVGPILRADWVLPPACL